MSTNRARSGFLAFFLLGCVTSVYSADSSGSEKRAVADAIAAIDACYYWGGEVGDQSEERNKDISQGVEHDCPIAKEKSLAAYKHNPNNSALAAKIVALIDVGYFPVTPTEKKKICETAGSEFKKEFAGSKKKDLLF